MVPEQLAADLAGTIARTGALIHETISAALVLSPEHARLLAAAGWSKADVRQAVYARAVLSWPELVAAGKDAVSSRTRWRLPADHPDALPVSAGGEVLHVLTSAEAILVVVAGAGNAGVSAVVETFGPAGAEDTRTREQRYHDGLHEALRRLAASGLLPERAGQPVKVWAHMSLADLLRLDGSSALQEQWTAQVRAAWAGHRAAAADPAWAALEQAIIGTAVDLLSGPAGLASFLRRRQLGAPLGGPSLPLDIGYAQTVPAAIRNAVMLRDQHCQWAGRCDQPAAACEVHHTKHKADGGKTSVKECVLLCFFHHQVAIHRWGWTLVLNPDGTTTAWNKNRTKVLHSHGPPARAG